MFDPDPQSLVLRLNREGIGFGRRPAADAAEALARVTIAQHEMDRASMRWVEAVMEYDALRAQAQPISAVRDGNVRF